MISTISWRTSSRNGGLRSGNCGTQSPQSRTGNVRGKCSSSAQGLDVIICCAQFHHATTTVCRICAWARFWDEAHDGSIVHSGPHGLTRCPCSNSVCHVSLVKLCTTSPTLTHPGVWASCRGQCPDWTATGSSLVLVGRCCDEVCDLDLL